jgi:hypothetical protein
VPHARHRLYEVVTKPKPNFTRLDPGRLEIAILLRRGRRARGRAPFIPAAGALGPGAPIEAPPSGLDLS